MNMTPEQKIRAYLIAHGISQAHVSRQTGITTSMLCNALVGKRVLTVAELTAICVALQKTPNDFLLEQESGKKTVLLEVDRQGLSLSPRAIRRPALRSPPKDDTSQES